MNHGGLHAQGAVSSQQSAVSSQQSAVSSQQSKKYTTTRPRRLVKNGG